MISYFLKCDELLLQAKNRDELFGQNINLDKNSQIINNSRGSTPIMFCLPFYADIAKIKHFIGSLAEDITSLTGTDHDIFSYKRNPNTSSLFNKYGFAQSNKVFMSQKCGRSNCSSCQLKFPTNMPIQVLPNFTLKLCTKANCKTDNIIYTAICKLCSDFYFGKTMTGAH